jgi:hypothetical protein
MTVDDVVLHQPSLDDVFFALTGHPMSESTDGGVPGTGSSAEEMEAVLP